MYSNFIENSFYFILIYLRLEMNLILDDFSNFLRKIKFQSGSMWYGYKVEVQFTVDNVYRLPLGFYVQFPM